MAKQEKIDTVKNLAGELKKASSVAFIDYSGMNVSVQQDLRNRLKSVGGRMFVAKNTYVRIAAKEANLPDDALTDEILSGQTATILASDDPVSPIQALGKFISEFEIPQFKAGVVEGVFQNRDGLIAISKLPSKNELQAKVVGAISAPLYGFVGTLQANMQKLIFILNQKAQS